MVGLLDALGAESAVIAGHDWGAPVAWRAVVSHFGRTASQAARALRAEAMAEASARSHIHVARESLIASRILRWTS